MRDLLPKPHQRISKSRRRLGDPLPGWPKPANLATGPPAYCEICCKICCQSRIGKSRSRLGDPLPGRPEPANLATGPPAIARFAARFAAKAASANLAVGWGTPCQVGLNPPTWQQVPQPIARFAAKAASANLAVGWGTPCQVGLNPPTYCEIWCQSLGQPGNGSPSLL